MSVLATAALVMVAGLGWIALSHFRAGPSEKELQAADFVVFRTKPVLLPMLSEDMAEAGWSLTHNSDRAGETLYRFEKSRVDAAALNEVLNADGVMQRIACRQVGADIVLAVDEFGSRKIAHA